jgi:hypothetical protein
MFVESPHPSAGGFMHWLEAPTNGKAAPRAYSPSFARVIDLEWLSKTYVMAATKTKIKTLAEQLGVTFDSLISLRVGWDQEAFTFPMQDAKGKIVGIRRRLPDGKKLSVKGGHEGLFVPSNLNGENPLYVCEGPTDCAALLTLGLPAVGRPSCTGGLDYLVELCRNRRVHIAADNDLPGMRGATRLKERLKNAGIFTPPNGIKDVRAWVNSGATRTNIEAAAF